MLLIEDEVNVKECVIEIYVDSQKSRVVATYRKEILTFFSALEEDMMLSCC